MSSELENFMLKLVSIYPGLVLDIYLNTGKLFMILCRLHDDKVICILDRLICAHGILEFTLLLFKMTFKSLFDGIWFIWLMSHASWLSLKIITFSLYVSACILKRIIHFLLENNISWKRRKQAHPQWLFFKTAML